MMRQLFLLTSLLCVIQFVSSYRHHHYYGLARARLHRHAQSHKRFRHEDKHHRRRHDYSSGQHDDNADDYANDSEAIDNQEALHMIQGLNGWRIHKNGIKYTCYTYFLVTCKKIIGNGSWEYLKKASRVEYVPGKWVLNEKEFKIFCNSAEGSHCMKKSKTPWTKVKNWKEEPLEESTEETKKIWDEPSSSHGKSVSVYEVLNLMEGLDGWSIVVNGLQYYCYSFSLDQCEKTIGNGDWELLSVSDKKYVPAPRFSDKGDTKLFCKGSKSKCKKNFQYKWIRVRDWQEPKHESTGSPPEVEGSIDEDEIIDLLDPLHGWKIIIHGVEYYCYAPSRGACEQGVGRGHWKRIPHSQKKDMLGTIYIVEGDANIFCKSKDTSKCTIKLKGPWKNVGESIGSPPEVDGSVNEDEIIDLLDPLDGWRIIIHGVEYYCYAPSRGACEQGVGRGHWKRIPHSQKKDMLGTIYIVEGDANIFCKSKDTSKCTIKLKGPWKNVGESIGSPPEVDGSVNEDEIIDLLDPLDGWRIIIHGVEYYCYAPSRGACEQGVGRGHWKRIPHSQKKDMLGTIYIVEGDANIFCKSKDTSKCTIKLKGPWKNVGESIGSPPEVDGSVNEEEIIDLLDPLDGWRIIIHGVEYYCYAPSRGACEQEVGKGHWKRIPDSQKKGIRGTIYIVEGDANIFCKSMDTSKCTIKLKGPWQNVGESTGSPPEVDGSVNIDEIMDLLDPLDGWSIIIHGVEYYCYEPSRGVCEQEVGRGYCKHLSDSQKKDIRGSIYTEKGDAKIFCKSKDTSKCTIKLKGPWKNVYEQTGSQPEVDGSVDLVELRYLLDPLEVWRIIIHGVQYYCYAPYVETCEASVGEGHWKPILDPEKNDILGSLFIEIDEAKIFCKGPNKSKCNIKVNRPWKTIDGSTGSPPKVNGSVNLSEVINLLDPLDGWSIIIHGVEYYCYEPSRGVCEQEVGRGHCKRLSDSQKKDIRGSIYTEKGDAKIFCKASNRSQCTIEGNLFWKLVQNLGPTQTIDKDDAYRLIKKWESTWYANINGIIYYCFSDSLYLCRKTIGEGSWKLNAHVEGTVPGPWLLRKNSIIIFSSSKSEIHGPWASITGWNSNPTGHSGASEQWFVEANYRTKVNGILTFCKARSESDCPSLPGAEPWEISTGDGAKAYFDEFPFVTLNKNHKDATCIH